jgi:hypothetical protein
MGLIVNVGNRPQWTINSVGCKTGGDGESHYLPKLYIHDFRQHLAF